MSYWTHSICILCYRIQYGNQVVPYKMTKETPLENCCFCGSQHQSGIYVREAPAGLWCKAEKGIHVNDARQDASN